MRDEDFQKVKSLFVESLDSPRIYVFGSVADGNARMHSDCGDHFVFLDDDTKNQADKTAKV